MKLEREFADVFIEKMKILERHELKKYVRSFTPGKF